MSLVKQFIEIKPIAGLGIGLRSKIYVILGRNVDESIEDEVYIYPWFGVTKQRCNTCLFHISGQNK